MPLTAVPTGAAVRRPWLVDRDGATVTVAVTVTVTRPQEVLRRGT